MVNDLDQFETSNGAKQFPRVGDTEAVLLRKRLREASEMDDDSTATGAHILLYGDFRHYVIADRAPAVVGFIPHLFGANRRPTEQRGWMLWWRVGADVMVPNAFRGLEVG